MSTRLILTFVLSITIFASVFAQDHSPDTTATPASAQVRAPELWGSLTPGPHAVAVRAAVLPKISSDTSGSTTNPVYGQRLVIWYPSMPGDTATPVTIGDYLGFMETRVSDADLLSWLRDDASAPADITDDQLTKLIGQRMLAVHAAEADEGRHPVAIWTMRHGIPAAQFVLNEYLASHGYIVVFTWPLGPTPPMPWEDIDAKTKRATFNGYLTNLNRTLDFMLNMPQVDTDNIALLAWSYGGETATYLQRSRPEVDAVISISCNTLSGWVFNDSTTFEALGPRDFRVPFYYITQKHGRHDAPAAQIPSLLYDAPEGSRYFRFERIRHGNFNVAGGMVPGVLDYIPDSDWSVGGEPARLGYETVCRLVFWSLADRFSRDAGWTLEELLADLPQNFLVLEHIAPDPDPREE